MGRKVNQIRIYSGQKYEVVDEAEAGTVCAVTGLSQTRRRRLGIEGASKAPILNQYFPIRYYCPKAWIPEAMLPKLRLIEEEEPELRIVWDESWEIQAQIMGEVQIEILQDIIKERFGVDVTFDSGKVVYKETISDRVVGVGHFEPLRHYAEVPPPGTRGEGKRLRFASQCSEDELGKNWQNLILTHLEKRNTRECLPVRNNDMKITLVNGQATEAYPGR